MSKRKQFEMLGETHLPDDLFTKTDGLNWSMDTFPDLGKGLGVLDSSVLQDNTMSNVPDGIILAMDEADDSQAFFGAMGDLGDITREASLTDLSWLEFAEQDPDRLPVNPVDLSIPELEEAWGVNRRTDGFGILPNVDREVASYKASLEINGPTKSANVKPFLQQAGRKLAAGESFNTVAKEIAQKLGSDAPLARQGMLSLQEATPLLGKVYIQASDYPGCDKGKWSEVVSKKSASARYVVAKKDCQGCVNAQNGSCAIFRKRIVASVPWREAVAHYNPMLEASGRKVASGDPKASLKEAFLKSPQGMAPIADHRPQHKVAADQISTEAARKAFAAAPAFKPLLLNASTESVHAHIQRWAKQGLLESTVASKLVASTAPPAEVLFAATRLVAAVKTGAYSGGLNAGKMGYAADTETVFRELAAAEKRAKLANQAIHAELERRNFADSREGKRIAAIERKAASVIGQIKMGLAGRALVAHILRTFEAADRGLASEILDPVIQKHGALKEPKSKVGQYSGMANDNRVSDVSADQAWASIRAAHPPAPLDIEHRQKLAEYNKMKAQVDRWARDGMLPESDAKKLLASSAAPRDVLRVATALINKSVVGAYSGAANGATKTLSITSAQAWNLLATFEQKQQEAEERIASDRAERRKANLQQKMAKINTLIEKGARGSILANYIRKVVAQDEVAEMSVLLDPVLKKTGALTAPDAAPRQYEGAEFERAPQQYNPVASGAAHGEVRRMARWVRQRMSEGFVGKTLIKSIASKFADSVRTAGETVIRSLLAQHEGLSGHLYVDAGAYASQTGINGCETGAAKHKASVVPNVLQMDRCGSCAQKSALENGDSVCRLYNKKLVVSAPVENPQAYQASTIRQANSLREERIAELNSNVYTDDFQLGQGGEMQNFEVAEEPTVADELEITYGGMEF